METTRHFTTKLFVVNDGETALHYHPKLDIYLPPGGHVERDELPHESALREAEEEIGLSPELYRELDEIEVPDGEPLPKPAYHILYDVDTKQDGEVVHQHIDLVYFGRVNSRNITPEENEVSSESWEWYSREDLEEGDFDPDTVEMAKEAIEKVKKRFKRL